MPAPVPEPFVDAACAAEFLSVKPRRLLELAREGRLLAYPLGDDTRRVWRFRLSELKARPCCSLPLGRWFTKQQRRGTVGRL